MEFPPNVNPFANVQSNNSNPSGPGPGNNVSPVLGNINFRVPTRVPDNATLYPPVAVPEQQQVTPLQPVHPPAPPPTPQPTPATPPQYQQPLLSRCCAERSILFRENVMLKMELQKCHTFIIGQREVVQQTKYSCNLNKKRLLKEHNAMFRKEKDMREKLEAAKITHQRQLEVAARKISEEHEKMKNVTQLDIEHQKTIKLKEEQIKELETIMENQQVGVEQLGLEKMLSQGKLQAILDFASEINADFQQGLDILERDFGLNTSAYRGTPSNGDEVNQGTYDEDEVVLRQLKNNLANLSSLVRDTFETIGKEQAKFQEKEAEQVAISEPVSKIHLKKKPNDGNGDWRVVRGDMNAVVKKIVKAGKNRMSLSVPSSQEPHRVENWKFNRCACGYQGQNKSALRTHVQYYRSNNGNGKSTKCAGQFLSCTLCQAKFSSKPTLSKHYQEIHKITDAEKRNCEVCGITFPTVGDLQQHKQMEHQQRWNDVDQSDFEKEKEENPQRNDIINDSYEFDGADDGHTERSFSSLESIDDFEMNENTVMILTSCSDADDSDASIQQQKEPKQRSDSQRLSSIAEAEEESIDVVCIED